jgi:Flp pilus assembly protein TadD
VQILWTQALGLLGRTDEARLAGQRCFEKFPNSATALAERANFALHDDDVDLAEECLSRAVKLEPGNISFRTKYAIALGRNDKKAQSDAEYEKVRQLSADSERIDQLIRGPLQSNPNDAEIHHEIGMIALRSGKIKEAIQWFNAAIQLDPNHLQTHRRLATIYHELENPVLAAKHRAIAQQIASRK